MSDGVCANISNNSFGSEITFELVQKFWETQGCKAKTRRNRFSIDFSVCIAASGHEDGIGKGSQNERLFQLPIKTNFSGNSNSTTQSSF